MTLEENGEKQTAGVSISLNWLRTETIQVDGVRRELETAVPLEALRNAGGGGATRGVG